MRVQSLPMPRGAGAAAVINTAASISPAACATAHPIADFAELDPSTNAWTLLPPLLTARDHPAAAAIDGRFYAVGGRAGQLFDVLEVYDPATDEWTDLDADADGTRRPRRRRAGGRLFTFGGDGNPADPQGIFPQVEVRSGQRPCERPARLADAAPRHGRGGVG